MASMFPANILQLAEQVVKTAIEKKITLASAESCTGGLLMGALTEIPGCSAAIDGGIVSYSYNLKTELLGLDTETLQKYGAVSEEVVADMADNILDLSSADIGISVSGICGPGGGTPQKPVGLVYIGIAHRDGTVHTIKNQFSGDRAAVRLQTLEKALQELLAAVEAA